MSNFIELATANRICEAALARGAHLGLRPLCVAVVDGGGHLVALQRQDGASLLRPEIAQGKAAGALALGVSSRVLGEMAAERPSFMTTLSDLAPHGLVPAAGGVIVVSATGYPIGAVGVTGDTSDNDEICALAGIETAGLSRSC